MKYKINVEKKSSGVYVATCEELPDIITHGNSLEEAKKNAERAIELFIIEKGTQDNEERVEIEEKIKRIKIVLASLDEERTKGVITEDFYFESKAKNELELEELEKKLIQ